MADCGAIAQVQPVRDHQLISSHGDVQVLVNLATLSDSLEYLAEAIQHSGSNQQPGQVGHIMTS